MKEKAKAWKKVLFGVFTGLCILGIQFTDVGAETTYTCKYNGASYTSLAAAVNAAKANEAEEAQITMRTNETLTEAVILDGKQFTLDLAGHKIDFPDSNKTTGIQINSAAKLTLEDSVGTGTISVGNDYYGVVYVNSGEFVMNGGTLISNVGSTGSSNGIYSLNGKFTVNDGKVVAKFPLYMSAQSAKEVQATITGGSFEGTKNSYIIGDVVARISGGTFTASEDTEALSIEIMNYDGYDVADVKISGGSFSANKAGISICNWLSETVQLKDMIAENGVLSDETTTLSGSTIYSANNLVIYTKLTESDITISPIEDVYYTGEAITPEPVVTYNGKILEKGKDYTLSYINNTAIGTATVNIDFLQPYIGNFSRTFQIIKRPDSCVANGVGYSSFAEAVAAVPENGTAKITMVSNETAPEYVYIGNGKDITLDLAGFDLEFPDAGNINPFSVRTKFTLEDSVGDGTISAGNYKNGVIAVWTDGDFVMNGGNIVTHENPSDVLTGVYCNNGKATINGGTIKVRKPIEVRAGLGRTELTVNGGKFEGELPSSVIGNAVVNINGGEFYGSIEQALNIDMTKMGNGVADVTISGGTFTGKKYGIIFWGTDCYEGYTLGFKDLLAPGCVWSDDTEISYAYGVIAASPSVSVYRTLTENDVVISGLEDAFYTGTAITPVPVVSYNGKTLVNGADYNVSYADNVQIGIATIKIDFQPPYVGSITKTFQIVEKPANTPVDEPTVNDPISGNPATDSLNQENSTVDNKIQEKTDTDSTDILKIGDIVSTKSAIYKITAYTAENKTVEFVKPVKKNATTVSIPATVKVKGTNFKVTSIAAKACKGNKKQKKLVIGKNIESIGKQAFSGCKKLKKIAVKTTKLTKKSVGKNAFKGIDKKVKISIPKNKSKEYKKLFTN